MNIEISSKKLTRAKSALTIILLIFFFSCSSPKFHEEKVDNLQFAPNTAFVGIEDLSSPKFVALKEKYQTDTIFHGETNELKRILLIRHWIKKIIKINDPGPHPGDGSCESILDFALKGNGFHCGHFMVVQNAVMNAYGYVTRCLGAGPGGENGKEGHHGINEVWLNSYQKWFLSDAKYDIHYEKDGIPLSALEIRDEYLKNKAKDVTIVRGPDRQPLTAQDVEESKIASELTYCWIEWNRDNYKYTNWPVDSSMMIVYKDNYSKTHTWIWDGKPHWAYNTIHMKMIPDRKTIEWTPNTIMSKVIIEGNDAHISLVSNTPNLEAYQIKEMSGRDWKNISNPLDVKLEEPKKEMVFRTINRAGVTGPEHKIIITSAN